ncbi:MAG: hypothetical protein ABSA40_07595, partial [Candidatus Dormibacteria bacterium]
NDNSVGGATGSGSPTAGDWSGIESSAGGSIDIEHADIDYAATAIDFAGSDANLADVTVGNVIDGIDVSHGSLAFRGAFLGVSTGVQACDWGSLACSVDAAYSYWGSPAGPFPSGQSALACGAVTVSSWYTSPDLTGTASGDDPFGVANCDGSSTPDTQLSTASGNYSDAMAQEGIDCGDGFEDACQAMQQAQVCLSGAVSVADGQSPFPFSTPDDAVSSLGDALASSEDPAVSSLGNVLGFGVDIVGVGATVLDLATAYNTCAP